MSIVESIDAGAAPQVGVQDMDRPDSNPFRSLARRAANRLMQRIVTATMRATLRAEAQGPDALIRHTERQRRIHMTFDAPVVAGHHP